MSESTAIHMTTRTPQPTYLKDYQPPVFLIDEVDLEFDLQENFTLVHSHLHIRHNRLSDQTNNDLVLNGESLILESIYLDGERLPKERYQITDRFLKIFNLPYKFDLNITTKIFPQQNTALSGLYYSSGKYCTQCEAEGFRRITYYLDHPDVLSRFTTKIIADEKQYPYLLSNGNLVDSGKLEYGRHWVKWEDPFKKPSYLFALVAGDFDVADDHFVTQSDRDVTLKIYVDKGYGDQVDHALFSLKEAMRWDEKAYGREYDLDIYMIVAISDFNMGAMENKGLNIFNTKYILAKPETANDDDYINILSVIGHEYFHNWSGNRVTCRDWFQLSLKEGLTIFRDQSFSEDTLSPAVMRIHEVNQLRETQFPEDAGPLAHPVRPDSYIEINNFYTATVYNKGAEVLRMLQTILGKDLFRKGMDLYFARHDGQAVTIEDYIKAMEDVSGIDLMQFRLWYAQAGTPQVTVSAEYNLLQKTYTLTFQQMCPETPGQTHKQPMFIPIKLSLFNQTDQPTPLQLDQEELSFEKVLHLTKETQTFQFNNIDAKPIPSLLRNFSAPVILNFPYADSELLFLFKHDTDPFNRFEAIQKYILRRLLNAIQVYQTKKQVEIPKELIHIIGFVLEQPIDDLFLLSEMLAFPSERYIGEQMAVIDVESIHFVRELFLKEIAHQLQNEFLQCYQQYHSTQPLQFDIAEIGKRQFKNRCLQYLLMLPIFAELAMEQFQQNLTINMTNTQAALIALSHIVSPFREKALNDFYQTWKNDALVIDKWLSIQASSKLPDTLQEVQKLIHHESFDIKNPNKVYALIGTFGNRNAMQFHATNGEGYIFLREMVEQLDDLNPQVSARMVKPLTMWKRYDSTRQMIMTKQLSNLLQNTKISSDLYELVSKSLENH